MFEPSLSIWLLALAVVMASVAIVRLSRNLRIERQRRKNAERVLKHTSHLEALASGLSKAQTPAEMTEPCLAELLYAVGASSGLLAFVDEEANRLEIVRFMGYADSPAQPPAIPLSSKTLLTEAVSRREPLTLTSQADRLTEFADLAVDPVLAHAQGLEIIPLVVAGRAIGVAAFSFEHVHSPADGEQPFLMSAAHRVALAVDRGRRYERAQRDRADAEEYRLQADRELHERQKAEEALRESEARYRVLAARTTRLHALSAGLSEAITLDAVAKVIVRQGKNVAGASAGSVALLVDGAQLETLFAEEYPRQIIEAWHRFPAEPGLCSTAAIRTGVPVFIGSFEEWQREYPRSALMAADGGYASAAVLPLLVDGSAVGVLSLHFTAPVNFDDEYRALLTSVAQHATQAIDRARLYETAQRARADAEAANRSKDNFLSIVSHELRTPLTAVLGWASMLRSQTLDPTRAPRAIDAIYNNATRQAQLIDELLDVSRIVAGRVSLDLHEIDLADNVRGAVEMVLPLVEAKRLNIHIELLPPDVRIVADARRLEQVFVNLLGNAVKFTPPDGHITVGLAASEQAAEVRVTDTGRGIDSAFAPYVFERFRQADTALTRSVSGLGLGLFIAQRLVVAHGGEIRAESEGEGRGATFTVSLPRAGAGQPTGRSSDTAPAQRRMLTESVASLRPPDLTSMAAIGDLVK